MFGYVRILWTWGKTGVIGASVLLQGLPAAQYQGRITADNWKAFVPDLLLVLITLVYIPLTVTGGLRLQCMGN